MAQQLSKRLQKFLRQEVLDHWGPAYGVGPEHLYTDYKEMLAKEQPDIVSVATQPEMRAEIMIYCATHGVKAIYAEKAFTASLEQAEEVTAVCKEQGVYVNKDNHGRDAGQLKDCGLVHEQNLYWSNVQQLLQGFKIY